MSSSAPSSIGSALLEVEGMHCGGCASRVERTLKAANGVVDASVNFATERANIQFNPAAVSLKEVAAVIEGAGFSIPTTTIDLDILNMTCASCAGRVQTALEATAEVVSAHVSVTTERATVVVRRGSITPEALVAVVEGAGYGAEVAPTDAEAAQSAQAREAARTRRQWMVLGLSVCLSLPLVAPMVAMPFGGELALPKWWQWALATPVQFFVGSRFYRGAFAALRNRAANMDVLVALGTTAAYALSVYTVLTSPMDSPPLYFESAAVVITLVLLGKTLERRAKNQTHAALAGLAQLLPNVARVLRDGETLDVAIESIAVDDILIVRPGERVAADGVIASGQSALDQSHLTGESIPVDVTKGDPAPQGAINQAATLQVLVTRSQSDSSVRRVIALVQQAQAGRAPVQDAVDRVAAIFVPAVLVITALTLAGWVAAAFFAGTLNGAAWTHAILCAVSVLVIACPCALGLATPAAIVVATGAAAKRGILIRQTQALFAAKDVAHVVFDKTGTLTEGLPQVVNFLPSAARVDDMGSEAATDALLLAAASIEEQSEHVLARAVVAAAQERGLTLLDATDVVATVGEGVEGNIDGERTRVGQWAFAGDKTAMSAALAAFATAEQALGHTVVYVGQGAGENVVALGALAIGDNVRPSTKAALAALRALHVQTSMLTGDHQQTAEAVAQTLGLDHVTANVRPEDKARAIEAFVEEGTPVAMVGDGINDAPALAAATVSFAMAAGTDIARDAADVTLLHPSVEGVSTTIALSRATSRTITQNLVWAFGFNLLGIPLAALGMLSPVIAGGAMAASSVLVIGNALRLGRALRA